ncbi:hypothetical protein DL93DRAFT_2214067 [Clavulina sp. PMI_390]|nr:hypothetical protein DL93DRAFT_2214067 [Clavulina sp. PMI_390]
MSGNTEPVASNDGALTFEHLRSFFTFFQSLNHDRTSFASVTLVPQKTFLYLNDGTCALTSAYSIGYCNKRLYELERIATVIHVTQQWVEREKLRAEAMRKRAKNQLVPISRLPNEVFSEILILSRDDNYHVWSEPVLSTCARWRQCALSTPSFWSSIIITDQSHPSELSLILSRSRTCPLTISFRLPCFPNQPIPPADSRRLSLCENVLYQALRHIASLEVFSSPLSGWLPSTILQSGTLRHLTYCFISGFVDEAEEAIGAFQLFSQANLSALANLTLLGGVTGSIDIGFTGFASLSSLKLNATVKLQSTWSLFSQCPILEELVWHADISMQDSTLPEDHLPAAYGLDAPTFPRLKSIELKEDACPLFFRAVPIPNIQEIVISEPPQGFLGDITAYVDNKTRDQILRLKLMDVSEFSGEDATAIVSSFPSLEELTSNSWTISSLGAADLLSEFDPDTDGQWHWKCPRLKRLELAFVRSLKIEKRKHGDTGEFYAFKKELSTALLDLLRNLVAERAKGETSQLRIHVYDIQLDLQRTDSGENWSAVHIAEERAASEGSDTGDDSD